MEKRYQVFVSSTYVDLTQERAAIIQAILGLDHLPAGMEMFPAADEDQWSLIKRVIDNSDYYVVVVGGRYGSVSTEGVSYTEKEYDYAVETGTPILGFVHGEPHKIESGKTDQKDDAKAALDKFRAKVETRMVKKFTSSAELGGQVAISLVQAIANSPGVGWVRGDKAMTLEHEQEVLELQKRLDQAEKRKREAENALFQDTSELAQGDDVAEIALDVYYWAGQKRKIYEASTDITWDELFKQIGPGMIDESATKNVRGRAQEVLKNYIDDASLDELKRMKVDSVEIMLPADSWDTIELQLRALELIDSGQKKRGIQDTGKYLRLTENGLRHLAFTRAIRKQN